MAFDLEFTDSRQQIAVDDISMSDMASGRLDITGVGDVSPEYVWSKLVMSQITISGIPVSMIPPQILPKLKTGNLIGIRVRLSNGEVYSGEIGIDRYDERPKGKNDPNLYAAMAGTFTGEKIQDGQKPLSPRTVGMKLDLFNGSSYTIGYQDSRMDAAVRPFYVDGVENNNLAIPKAIDGVVTEMGGYTHTHPYDDTLHVLTANASRFDHNSVNGVVVYGRGPRDCSPAAPSVTVGYDERKKRVTFTFDGADATACHGVTIIKTIKVKVPVLSIRLPCVWTDVPPQLDFVGKVSSSGYSFLGFTFGGRTLVFDGIDYVPYDSPAGIYYVGTIKFRYRADTWKKGSVGCIGPVPAELEGDQTVPSYVLTGTYESFYEYEDGDFLPLDEICPNCYE